MSGPPERSAADEPAGAKIIPFAPLPCTDRCPLDFSARATYGVTLERIVHVSRKIRSAAARHQKISTLDRGFSALLAEAQISAADWQMDFD